MSYSDFKSLEKAQTDLDITINETAGLFQGIPPVEISDLLRQTLDFNIPLFPCYLEYPIANERENSGNSSNQFLTKSLTAIVTGT